MRFHIFKIEVMANNDGVVTSDYQANRDFIIVSLIRQIKVNKNEMALIDKQIESFLDHFDYPLTQMKGIDSLTAAKLIVEIGDIDRFPNASSLARYSGVAPVTYSSGMTALQFANMRGNRQLNEILYRLALSSIMPIGPKKAWINPISYEYYQKKLSEGKTKKQALKSVQRRLVNMIFAIMKHKREYINPSLAHIKEDQLDAS